MKRRTLKLFGRSDEFHYLRDGEELQNGGEEPFTVVVEGPNGVLITGTMVFGGDDAEGWERGRWVMVLTVPERDDVITTIRRGHAPEGS